MTEIPTSHSRGAGEVSPPSERPKTKIAAVREQLQANKDVYFAGEIHDFHPDAPNVGYWTETVSMIVAPTNPQFDVDKLNVYMDGLITEVDLSAKDRAYEENDGGIHLGKLYYDEAIGLIRIERTETIETTELETVQRAGKKVGETKAEEIKPLQRRTWVRVYPDTLSAHEVYEYEQGVINGTFEPNSIHGYTQHWLRGEQIRELKAQHSRGPVSKVIGFLQRGK